MVIVTLIRHGETEHNAEARLQGWSESELSGLGRRQACLTGRVLSQRVPKVERIWTSDLCRGLDTSKIIAQELGSDNQSLIRSTSLLREASYGVLEGMKVSDAIKRLRREGKTWQDYGESIKDVETRLAQAWRIIMDEVNGSGMLHVVVVTHGSM
jgi:broad specificity phosphatase PhoE